MKKLIVIILVLIGFAAYAQPSNSSQYLNQTAKWKFVKPQWLDSGMYLKNIVKLSNQNRVLCVDSVTGKVAYKYISSATTIDTTSLSNRINLKLNISDTAAMLSPYALSSEVPTYLAGRGITKSGVTFRLDTTQYYTWTNSRTRWNAAPTATPNYGLVSFGSGAFDGVTSGFFSGAAAGTLIAGNAASGYTGDLLNAQLAGVQKAKINYVGTLTIESITNNSTTQTALFFVNSGAGITWNNNATIKSPSAGVITIGNEGISDFARLQFGGTTSSFPALKRSTTMLQVRLADDSGDANLSAKSVRGVAVTFANVPTPVEGMMLGITDSTTDTWGSTITGGGSLHVLAYYNGTNWTVFGK